MALGRRARKSERAKLDATPPWSTDRERDTELTTGPYDVADTMRAFEKANERLPEMVPNS